MINSVKAPCDEGVLRSQPVHAPSAPHVGLWILVATILGGIGKPIADQLKLRVPLRAFFLPRLAGQTDDQPTRQEAAGEAR